MYLEENPDDAKQIINKVIIAVKARKAAKAAKDSVLRKGALEGMTLPGKLADCQSKSAEESEIFIVEGDSAGGSARWDVTVVHKQSSRFEERFSTLSVHVSTRCLHRTGEESCHCNGYRNWGCI